MIVLCSNCGRKNHLSDSPNPKKTYRCSACKFNLTLPIKEAPKAGQVRPEVPASTQTGKRSTARRASMFGISYVKFDPTTHVFQYRNGRVVREGRGLAFYYFAFNSSIVAVPVGSSDLSFVFNQPTADFQMITVQGQLTYRVVAPAKLAEMLDFTIDGRGGYRGDDPEKLGQRLVNEAQTAAAKLLETLTLKQALRSPEGIIQAILAGLKASPAVGMLGVEPLSVSIIALNATPEMARALEAEAREALQQEADRAIYSRRNYAVEQERLIKESELNTEIAVEEKRRTIRETQMNADIAVEDRRKSLIDLRAQNERKEADTRSYAIETMIRPLSGFDWRILHAMNKDGLDPSVLIADAFEKIATNAERIGTLNISPDLLDSLLKKKQSDAV